ESLKDFKLNFENNPEYVVKNSDLGKTPSYFGYVLQDENGFGVKVSLDENNKVLIDNIKLAGVENVTLDVLTSEQKITLKKVVEEKISKSKDEINKLQNLKFQFESKSDDDRKYYLTDSVDKQLSVLNNDIKNYDIILSQI
ncbi:MAG TPA: Clp protease ClpB, partial [Candidatus Dwaynia gallinarum]|nr:Clp protease ClpB [Candidatus Dwaynia gallinarum]